MRILGRYEGPHAFGFAGDRFGVWDFGAKVRSAAGFRGTMQASSPTNVFRAIPHNSKCRRKLLPPPLLTKKIRPIQNSSHHSKRGGQKFDLQYLG